MIAVIDYGLGNLRSVSKALESLGARVQTTNDPSIISKADGVVLPGVGAFRHGMENLKKLNLVPAIQEVANTGKPFIGICLGLQLLFSETEEHGIHKGLDIVKGKVKKFTRTPKSLVCGFIGNMKIPHMGWNQIRYTSNDKRNIIFNNIPDNSYFYFVHSYYVECADEKTVAATTNYGIEFTSAIVKENIFGTQFHPEKSSTLGLKILENFIKLSNQPKQC